MGQNIQSRNKKDIKINFVFFFLNKMVILLCIKNRNLKLIIIEKNLSTSKSIEYFDDLII